MPPKVADDTSRFLYLCLVHSSEGNKIDFGAMSTKLGIKKHSLYCRWNTLQKQWGDDPGAADAPSTPAKAPATPKAAAGEKRKRNTSAATPRAKKAKIVKEDVQEETAGGDGVDVDESAKVKPEPEDDGGDGFGAVGEGEFEGVDEDVDDFAV